MPKTRFQRTFFAFVTVLVTVHGYVFYSLYVVNGVSLMAATGASGVLEAIRRQGGILLLGRMSPIWGVVLVEFCLAFLLEMTLGSPWAFRLVCRVFDPRDTHPVLFETAIICATVGLMCPVMSLLAAVLYYPWYAGFSVGVLLASWVRLVCVNFPFAFFSQLFFIQPLVRSVFRAVFLHRSRPARA